MVIPAMLLLFVRSPLMDKLLPAAILTVELFENVKLPVIDKLPPVFIVKKAPT